MENKLKDSLEINELKKALRDAIINTNRIIKTTTEYDPAGSTYEIDWVDKVKAWAELCDLDLEKFDPFFYTS